MLFSYLPTQPRSPPGVVRVGSIVCKRVVMGPVRRRLKARGSGQDGNPGRGVPGRVSVRAGVRVRFRGHQRRGFPAITREIVKRLTLTHTLTLTLRPMKGRQRAEGRGPVRRRPDGLWRDRLRLAEADGKFPSPYLGRDRVKPKARGNRKSQIGNRQSYFGRNSSQCSSMNWRRAARRLRKTTWK
jgi:hypothetical protein